MRIDGLPSIIAGAKTFLGVVKFADGSASAPSITFASEPTWGLSRDAALGLVFSVAADDSVAIDSAGMVIQSSGYVSFGSSGLSTPDVFLRRDAANTLAQRNGTSDQSWRLYAEDAGTDIYLELQAGVPAVSTCGDGALATGSIDIIGRVTSSNATACTVTFSAALGLNSADCFIENLTANRGNVSAASTTAFTVSNLTAGDDFMYWCAGR